MKRWRSKYTMFIVMLILVITAAFLLYPVANTSASEQTGRIAYLDVWAVFNVHPQKAVAEAELNQLAQLMQSELEEKARDLPANEQQEMLREYQAELSYNEQTLIQEIINSIKEVVVIVAEEKEIEMVLDKKNVIYGGYDLSDAVLNYIKQEEDILDKENSIEEDGIIDIEASLGSEEE